VSIYDKVGGAEALRTAVVTFYDRVVADPELARYFETVDLSRLRGHQQSFLISALGGPDYYDGRDLRSAHSGLGVSDAAFDRIVGHLRSSLEVVGVDPGVIAQVVGRVEDQRTSVIAPTGEDA
jgi:hemoglobin